jgi:hypothetical protein
VFGLSTALWLRQSGYEDVTVFDMQDTAGHGYSPSAVDSASADLNKIIRFSYGAEIEYQRLATEAAVLWDEWNAQMASVPEAELPAALRGGEKKLWWNAGMLRMSGGNELSSVELETLDNMAAEGLRDRVFRSDDEVGRPLPPAPFSSIYFRYRNGTHLCVPPADQNVPTRMTWPELESAAGGTKSIHVTGRTVWVLTRQS